MEPDHAATIEDIALRYPEATIVCNAKIKTMLARFFPTDLSDRLHIVKEGDTLSTGRHNFTFVMAPMVHWPEVMMTYDLTDKILFSADAFGSFGALNGRIFADECDFMHEYLDEARRYYTNIVGKYGAQVQSVLKKAAGLQIDYVCPLHSFVWRKGFGDFLAKYLQWSSYTPEENGVLIAYASVYGHTENAANILGRQALRPRREGEDVRHLRHPLQLHSLRRFQVQPPGARRHHLQRRRVHHHGAADTRPGQPQPPGAEGRPDRERLLGPGQRQADARHALPSSRAPSSSATRSPSTPPSPRGSSPSWTRSPTPSPRTSPRLPAPERARPRTTAHLVRRPAGFTRRAPSSSLRLRQLQPPGREQRGELLPPRPAAGGAHGH